MFKSLFLPPTLRTLVACAAALLVTPAVAGPNAYTGNGPDGGRATHIEFDSSNADRAYALGYGNGLFVSDDSGATWSRFEVNEPSVQRSRISDFALDPNAPDTMWVVDSQRSVARTTDGGVTWTSSGVGLENAGASMFYLWADQTTAGTVFAGASGELYRSTDNGDTWQDVSAGLSGTFIEEVMQSPSDPLIFYTSNWDGMHKSVDGGLTWTTSYTGFPLTSNGYVFARVGGFDPDNSDIAYVHISNQGIFQTVDGGSNWAKISLNLPGDFYWQFSVDPGDSTRFYMASGNNDVIVSNDSGVTWQSPGNIGLGRYTIDSIAFDPTDPTRMLVAAFTQGIFETTDSGATWTRSTAGFVNENVESLSVDKATGRIYAGVFGGTSRSNDEGASWTHNTGDYDLTSYAIEADPLLADHAYAGSSCCGLYETFDGGITWARINLQLPSVLATWVTDIDIPASNTSQLLFSDYNRGLFKTDNGGASWAQVSTGLEPFFSNNVVLDVVKASDNNPDVIYVGSPDFNSGGVFKSTDGGITWARKSGDELPGPGRTFSLAVHPDNPDIVLAGAFGVLYYSDDGGDTWEVPASRPPGTIEALYMDAERPLLAYAATNNGGLYRSVDGGLSWTIAAGLVETNRVNSMAVDPREPGRVLLGFDNIGYREYTFSTDLRLTDDSGPVSGDVGVEASLAATVTVDGPRDASRLLVVQSVPAELNIVSATSSTGICAIDGQDVSCELGNVASPATATITLVVTPVSDGDFEISTQVSSLESDPDTSNNTLLQTVNVGSTVVDTDGDGVADDVDNCQLVANPAQVDSNGDGYGNRCDADLNNDCIVNVVDLGALRSVFFTTDPDADLNADGTVNVIDLGLLRSLFFQPPGPAQGGACET